MTTAGVTLGVIGPFGSYLNGSLPARVGYWVAGLWIGWLALGVTLPMLRRWADRRSWPIWLWAPPAVAVLNLAPALASRALATRLWPRVGDAVGWPEWYGQSLVISAIASLAILWFGRPRTRDPDGSGDALAADPRDRLPARLGRTVLCLQMEDHYVRVHTTLGSTLVLMSLSQAIAGLKGLDGMQTHRSWWVAREAIAGVVEDGRRLRLRLTGGIEAPVSRARVGVLREKGWISAR